MTRRTSGVDLEYRARLEKLKGDLNKIPGMTKKAAREAVKDWNAANREMARKSRESARKAARAWDTASSRISAGIDAIVPGVGSALDEIMGLEAGLGAIAPALGAAAVVGGFVAITAAAADSRSEIIRLSEESGVLTEQVQAVQFALEAVGRPASDADGLLEDIGERMHDAAIGGGEAAEGFERLKVEVTDAYGKLLPTSEVLPEIFEALQGIPDPAQRSAAAVATLGDSGRAAAQALGDTRFEDYVALVSTYGADVGPEAIARTKEWETATAGFSLVMGGVLSDLESAVGAGGLLQSFTAGIVGTSAFISEISQQTAGWREEKQLLDDELNAGTLSVTDYYGALWQAYDATNAVNTATTMAKVAVEDFNNLMESAQAGPQGSGGGVSFFDPDAAKKAEKAAEAARTVADEQIAGIMRVNEHREAAFLAEVDRITSLANMNVDQRDNLLEQAREVADTQIAEARRANEEIAAAVAASNEAWLNSTFILTESLGQLFTHLYEQQSQLAQDGSEEAKKAARAWFGAYKATAIVTSLINTALAVSNALASIPYPANIAAAAAMGVAGAIQTGVIAAQQPRYHTGGIAPDEQRAVLRRGEAVITPQAVTALGELNRGQAPTGGGQGPMGVAIYGHRLFDEVDTRRAMVPSSVASRLRQRAARRRPGRTEVYAR